MFQSLKLVIFALIFVLISGCRSESRENSRAYAEGKIISKVIDLKVYKIKIVQNNRTIAETFLEDDYSFKLSGPISDEAFSLISLEKIESFSAEKQGLKLSADHLQIEIPRGNTYLKFNEIKLEK